MSPWILNVALAAGLQLPFLFALGLNFDVCNRHNFLLAGGYAIAMNVAISLLEAGAPSVLVLLIPVLCALVLLLAAERIVYWPLEKMRRSADEILVASLGLNVIAEQAMSVMFGDSARFPPPLPAGGASVVQQLVEGNQTNVVIATGTLLTFGLVLFLRQSETGARLTALSENAVLFKSVGFGILAWRLVAIVFVAVLIGISGTVASNVTGVFPAIGFKLVILGFLTSMLGGPVHRARFWFVAVSVILVNQVIGYAMPSQWQKLILFLLLFTTVAVMRQRTEAGSR